MRAAEMRIGCGTLCWLLLLCRTASILVPGEWTTLRMKMTAFNANGWNGATYQIWNASNVGQTIDWQLTMRDSMYAGWNGNEWYLKDESDVILANGTMNSGLFEEFVTFSTTVGTVLKFTIDPTNGGYSSYHSWEIGTTTEIFYSVQEGAASSILHSTDLQFTMPGERLNDGTLSSGEQQLTVLVDVQVGDILAFSLLEGSESSPANVAWELSEPDGVVIYSAEYASIAGVKFPLLENFVVAGPAACIQNQASDLELYSSDIDFSSLYPKRMFTDDTYIYFVPPSSKFFRVDVATMTQVESVTVTGSDYQFGFSDGTYGYLVPGSMGSILERVELGNFDSMSLSSISASYIGYTDAVLWRSTYTYAAL